MWSLVMYSNYFEWSVCVFVCTIKNDYNIHSTILVAPAFWILEYQLVYY